MLGMACGLAYDVRLKRTVFSAVPFMIAIPTLPLWVWVTLGEWHAALWWLLPLGALIGLALHLANTLPDIDDDAAHGVRGPGASARRARLDARRLGVVRRGARRLTRRDRARRRLRPARGIVPAARRSARACLVASDRLVTPCAGTLRRFSSGFGVLGVGSAVVSRRLARRRDVSAAWRRAVAVARIGS